MNEIGNKFLPIGDKLMPGMHLKQPGFTYRACGPFPKNKKRIEKFMQTGNMEYIYKNDLEKAYFQHDMAYGNGLSFLGMQKKRLDYKDKVNLKFMTSQPGEQIKVHILLNMSRIKGNKTMKFGQLIEYLERNKRKTMQKMRQVNSFQITFFFFLELYIR